MLLPTLQHRTGLQSSSDFAGYRKYASRRLKKLRHRQNLTVKPSKSYKPQPLAPGQWQLALLLAERSWAAAMAARAALEADAAAPAVLRGQISSKLAKAVKYSHVVLTAQPSDLAGAAKLEFAVYESLVAGEEALEKQRWELVSTEFSKVRVGLVALSKQNAGEKTNRDAEQVYGDLLTTKIDPALRLAFSHGSNNNNANQQHSLDIVENARSTVLSQSTKFAELVREVSTEALSKDTATSKLPEIQFRQHTAKVNYNALAEALINAREQDAKLRTELESTATVDAAVFEAAMTEWDQVEFITSNLISEINSTGQQREQELDIILTYAKFNLLYRRIQRDALEAQKEQGKPNAMRLYDVVLQSCTSMAELPGVYNDEELSGGIGQMTRYFRTRRSLALAALHPEGSREALALVHLAYKRIVQGIETDVEGDDTSMTESAPLSFDVDLPVSSSDIDALRKEVTLALRQTFALTTLYTEVANRALVKGSVASDIGFARLPTNAADARPIVSDIDVKKIDPVPVKPVFYDIAYNYVRTNTDDVNETRIADTSIEEKESPKKKKGLFGLF